MDDHLLEKVQKSDLLKMSFEKLNEILEKSGFLLNRPIEIERTNTEYIYRQKKDLKFRH